ncbi:phosphoadenylyl-sulfate reductase [Paroceanicella profunda]|uniref:Adenosine 5'-phosphosulfate reductase n=1 Tax=Paroceanicella profunda TaxID=2579971 RepID=A0A5B8FWD6_9RHOB|nr:phosphoadenylyl-sulfate reductase [Paroceanicella profunda]QDL92815.1 phosphoadenylyl-sulfate reductase [Paroceanicella profunda]
MTDPRSVNGDKLVSLPAPTVAHALSRLAEGNTPQQILKTALTRDFPGRIALVSSFGAESAPLLHMVSQIDKSTPVLFLETGMLFPATLSYQQDLAETLGLTDVRVIRPSREDLLVADPNGQLHKEDPDACCGIRKTLPLNRALEGFSAWITGRKRYQSSSRAELEFFDADADGRIKVNPLAMWDAHQIRAYMEEHQLPLHPMVSENFPSIGCAPCTTPVAPGEDPRAGRWRGREKVECGIHIVDGKVIREEIREHEGVVASFM